MEGTVRCSANYVPLTPISFIEKAALVFRDQISVIYGSVKFTWTQTHDRCLRLASALSDLGISRGDVVAVLSPNTPAMYELHFGVPMAGAILCTLNIRHDSSMISTLLKHSDAKVIFVDNQLLDTAQRAIALLSQSNSKLPRLVHISEPFEPSSISSLYLDYETMLSSSNPSFIVKHPIDECDPISLNYTSGTTSNPKGVVYSHRGAYLNSLASILCNDIPTMPVYLWTVPMFHCNGWCFAWGIASRGGTNVCIRKVTGKIIFDSIHTYKVTHLGGAPTVLSMIVNCPPGDRKRLPSGKLVGVAAGAAPPPPQILAKMEELGFRVSHQYGLTETYGPAVICVQRPEWDELPINEKAKLNARQGFAHVGLEEADVKDPVTLKSVPSDGKTMGEVMLRGNTVMNGYYKNLKATQEAFNGGWFRSGDLGVKHSDGYIQLKDRSKDIIISGGENISTIEVESIIFNHPAVADAAVVGRPDEYWGETPVAFVHLKDGVSVTADDIIRFCRDKLPHYMVPKHVVFGELPKTSTGKTQKFVLREKAKNMHEVAQKVVSKL